MLVSDYFTQTHSMVDEIKETFKRRVKQHDWIDNKTTQYVFEKVWSYFNL